MNEKRGFFRDNGLSLVLGALFVASLIGQYVAGLSVLNEERLARGEALVPWTRYLLEPHFLSATFENWESEFLQMGIYVLLSAWLYQRGSAESQALPGDESPERVDEGPTPWPAARGGLWRRLYGQTLAAALLVLCVLSFLIHWRASWLQHLEQARAEGEPLPGFVRYLGESQFWFESCQNWQSEFVSVLAVVLLSIVLRQKDSPQSKAVEAPHRQTGT
jgi:hypothetical protein